MAELVGGAFLSAFLQVLFDRLTSRDFLNLFKGKKPVEKLLKRLKTKLWSANVVLNDAEEKQLTNPAVKEWLNDLKEVIFRADEMTDNINYEVLRRKMEDACESSISTVEFAKSVEEEIEEILDGLEELISQRDDLGLKERKENIVSQRSHGTPLALESEVYGREDDKEAIIKLVLSDEACGDKIPMVLPIVGMGGIGKTTLSQLVFNDERVENHFPIKVWITISIEFDVFNVTKQLFKGVTSKNFDNEEISQLQHELSKALVGQKFLFALDDVWTEDYHFWDDLRRPFQSGASGSKIIITTRSAIVASRMSKVEVHNLRELSDDISWKFFIQQAFENEDLNAHPDLKKVCEEIVRKCKGLPLAIKSVAGLLRSISSLDEWRMILENEIWDLKLQENASKYVLPVLWLSYCNLSPQLKRCFAYCSIFPKDYKFDREKLILLWMAEGLLQPIEGTLTEDVGKEYFKTLTSRSFFQKSALQEKSSFVMHNCVHDLATFVSGDFGFRLKDNNNLHNLPSKTLHLSIMFEKTHDFKKFEGLSNAKCLRTFLPIGIFDVSLMHIQLQKSLMEAECLRVLSLSHSGITELPDSIRNLKHLRYLDLSSTLIKEIPSTICTLYNLETLLLKHCRKLEHLPAAIGRLIKLRHLNFFNSCIKELPLQICNMKDLQTLTSFIVSKEHGSLGFKWLGDLKQLHGTFDICGLENVVDVKNVTEAKLREKKFLTRLCLFWNGGSSDSMKEREILDQLQPHTNLKVLCISGYNGTRFSDWMGDQSFSNIVEVELETCENCSSLPALGQLQSLKKLWISEFSGLETLNREFYSNGSSMTKPFVSLEELRFWSMEEWKEWLFNEGVVFPRLKKLEFDGCPKLDVRLPDCFPSLTKLRVSDCRQLMPLLVPGTHQPFGFPSLQELEIRHCPEQEFFLQGGLPLSLQKIEIHRCTNLKALNEGFGLLTSLQSLQIDLCEELKCLPEELPSYLFDFLIEGCPVLESRCQKNCEDWPKIKHTRLFVNGLNLTEFSSGMFYDIILRFGLHL
ncbi:hypothetical protein UlMin_006823 [Ulmus minor]